MRVLQPIAGDDEGHCSQCDLTTLSLPLFAIFFSLFNFRFTFLTLPWSPGLLHAANTAASAAAVHEDFASTDMWME
jgi:hypothetical protein